MKKFSRLLCMLLVAALLVCGMLACDEEKPEVSITLSAASTTIARGASVQLTSTVTGTDSAVTYEIVEGAATVSATGLVTANQDAAVDSTVKVVAKVDDKTSETVSLRVVGVTPTALTLSATATKIAKGGSIVFTVTFDPAYATDTAYTLSLQSGSDFAELDAATNKLTIKNTAVATDIQGKTIVVVATLDTNPAVKDFATITVENAQVDSILSENVNLLVNRDANQKIRVEGCDADGNLLEVSASDCTFTVPTESQGVLSVDALGNITAIGHGTATVTITHISGKSTTCTVNVMVPPESIDFGALNTHMASTNALYFGMNKLRPTDATPVLDLGVVANNTALTPSSSVVYTFTKNGAATTAATYTAGEGIRFTEAGTYTITVTSNSAIGTNTVDSRYEASRSITVHVNNGVNIKTISDLRAYSPEANDGVIANFLADLYLTDTDNFGNGDNATATLYMGIEFFGNRTLYGNGYKISAERLSRGLLQQESQYNFIRFVRNYSNPQPFSVTIKDLSIIGNINYNAVHKDGNSIINTQHGVLVDNFKWGLRVEGASLYDYDNGTTTGYVSNLTIDNVTVKGFVTGLRVAHAIQANISNFYADDCFQNGIENVQSHMTLHNIEIGQVGAFGLEVAPDDMRDVTTDTPKGTAGVYYNQTPTINFTGTFKSRNLNNGASTVYMSQLKVDKYSIPEVVNMLLTGAIQAITSDTAKQLELNAVLDNTIRYGDTTLNFYTLVFVDYTKYTGNHGGNTTGKFCQFNSTEKINIVDLLIAVAQNPNFDYSQYKYLVLDLDLSAAGMPNIGQLILVNKAYTGE